MRYISDVNFNKIWNMQAELNLMVGRDTLKDNKDTVDKLKNIRDYMDAFNHEVYEAKNEFFWKWWSKEVKDNPEKRFEIKDLNHLKIELIDMLHFMISAMQCTKPDPIYWLYLIDWNLPDYQMIRNNESLYFTFDTLTRSIFESDIFKKFFIVCDHLGMKEDEIVHIYEEKWKVNKARQDNNYSVTTKTEADNDELANRI